MVDSRCGKSDGMNTVIKTKGVYTTYGKLFAASYLLFVGKQQIQIQGHFSFGTQ